METVISEASREALAWAKTLIERGEVVAFHTETVYGLGADARSDEAVRRIFELKGRPADNPLIVHVHKDYDISALTDKMPSYAEKLLAAFCPGPLTMVFPSTEKASKYVSCGLNTLAVRVPSSRTAQAFLRAVDLPIAAPSANVSKHISPVTARHVYEDFKGKIPLILDGGACAGGIESTVLDCTGKIPQILRAGLVTREMVASVAGDCGVYKMAEGERPKSPGMAYKHYSPRCKTAYVSVGDYERAEKLYSEETVSDGRPVILCEHSLTAEFAGYETLDLGDSPEEMAHNLYDCLHRGEEGYTLIIAVEPKGRGGVMDGVLNRLTRACRGE